MLVEVEAEVGDEELQKNKQRAQLYRLVQHVDVNEYREFQKKN